VLRHGEAKTYGQDFEVTMRIGIWIEIQRKPENPANE
jgi:hypothetical protein